MKNLLKRIGATAGCRILAEAGFPKLERSHKLPDDLTEFYKLCGGVELYSDALFPVRISAPSELVPANPVIIGEQVRDISDSWYIIGRGGGDEYMSIDLAPDRSGMCYDSFREVHGLPGSCAVIGLSFTDLLTRLVAARGGHWYWLEPGFASLGDAYDSVRLAFGMRSETRCRRVLRLS
jgi:antitoxin YokJ